MTGGYGQGFYGAFTYGALDFLRRALRPTRLSVRADASTMRASGGGAAWLLDVSAPSLVVRVVRTSMTAQVDELL